MAQARADVPIHELITRRWSPYAFADRSIPTEDLRALFEAARWAPSCYNEQPWSDLVAKREETESFERLLSCLVEANQAPEAWRERDRRRRGRRPVQEFVFGDTWGAPGPA